MILLNLSNFRLLQLVIQLVNTPQITIQMDCPRGDGVIDSVLAGWAGEPGSIPALSKWVFSLGYKVVG